MSNILSVPFSRTLLAKAAFFNDVKIMSSLRSFMQVLIRHFTIFQSGWFVQKNWEKLSKFVEVTAKILSVPFLWQGVCIYVTVNVYISWFTQELYMFTENVRKYTYFLKFGSDFCTDLLSGNFFHECICEYGEKWAISMSLTSQLSRSTDPWLWGCLGLPCTICTSGHKSINQSNTTISNAP